MLVRLKAILNSYTDEELRDMKFYCKDEDIVKIVVEKYGISLISEGDNIFKQLDEYNKEAK